MASPDYVTRVFGSPLDIGRQDWNRLLALETDPSPFMRHEYLCALHESGAARPRAGWQPSFVTLWLGDELQAACPMYLKNHSYGEYVFDWAWANAYEQHGLAYYPKALVAVPFTPVPGARLLASNQAAREALVQALVQHCKEEDLSSLHVLFAGQAEVKACEAAGMMLRHTVQFHWKNVAPTLGAEAPALDETHPEDGSLRSVQADAGRLGAADLSPSGAGLALGRPGGEAVAPTLGPDAVPHPVENTRFRDFEHFLASLHQEKRKKIRQERRKVAQAGVTLRHIEGSAITRTDWAFFYRCYERTYLEHGNAPYLSPDFFARMATDMPENWLLFVAERQGAPIASSLIAIDRSTRVAYGRYWGALERVDCLHFEACYYRPLAWCLRNQFDRFEGGAQGEHKMARALLPVKTTSAHWLAHPAFADAVERFLAREGDGIEHYLAHLAERNPMKPSLTSATRQTPDNV